VVIGSSPPILVSLAAYLVARVRRLPFVFEVRDLWPESLEAVGAAQRNSLTYRIIGRLAHSLYRRADRIVVDGEWKRRALVKRGVEPGKILVFFNGVSDEFRAEVRSDSAAEEGKRLRHELALDDCFVALYFGTLGMAHALETVLEAAQRLRSHKGIAFLLVGDGAERERLIERKQALGLDNVVISYRVPRDRIPGVLAAADGFLVPLRRSEVFKTAIPSKMFEAMAAGRPVILGVEGEAREILMNARAGLAIPPEDSSSLADAILQIASNPARAARMGECGQTAVAEKYSRQKLAAEYVDHLASLIGGPICQGGCATEQQIRSLEGKADPPAIS
jgi:glycosyltransferase involved in cell wall biosynthesis